jgi:FkbM family methyltransferase
VTQAYFSGKTPNDYMLSVMRQFTIPGDQVVDLGAHIGTFSVPAAAMGRAVLAVDAAQFHVDLLERDKTMNHLDTLTICCAAISQRNGFVHFVENGLFGMVEFGNANQGVQVPAKRLDDLARLCKHPVRFLKMDIEGSELDAVVTGRDLLASDQPAILFESNDMTLRLAGQSVVALRTLLETCGYKTFRIENDRYVYAPPDQIQPEAWVDMLALGKIHQTQWSKRIDWNWPDNAMVERCHEWAASPYANVR